MFKKLILLLLPLFFLFSCRSVQPPVYPIAGLYPTVDVARKLDGLRPLLISEAELRGVLQSLHVWGLLISAGMQESALSLLSRGLAERGYAEVDARRAASSVHWVSFASMDGKKLEVCVAFLQAPPPSCRGGIMLEKTPSRQESRSFERSRKLEYQYINIWHCPMESGHPLEIWKISGQYRNRPDNTHWELHRAFSFTR